MNAEAGFLDAIEKGPHDDAVRLIYADWLDERDDPRGEYLRIQCELKRIWSYQSPCKDLFSRAAKLRKTIDPNWLLAVRRCTTPAPPVDLAKIIPGMKALARTAVRLHPRRGTSPADASKIGGLFLWPGDEEWPTCSEHDCPLVPALQLRKEDVPEVGFRRGTDLFQVLWCPHDHEPGYCPAPRLFWRKRSRIKSPLPSHPASEGRDTDGASGQSDYIPVPCVLQPERVREYPDPFEPLEDVYEKIESSEEVERAFEMVNKMRAGSWYLPDEVSDFYQCWLSTTQATKVGGHPDWVQDPAYPLCPSCGKTMDHLLSFGSWEFDGATWGRWLPIEDRDSLTGDYTRRKGIQFAPEWMFGDAGRMYLFICRQCKDWPIAWDMQCS